MKDNYNLFYYQRIVYLYSSSCPTCFPLFSFFLSILFFIAFLFSIVLNILIAYAKYEIVLENKWVFEAIWISSQIALLNIKTTLRLYVLMFFMNIKVIVNFFIFLIFPILWAFIAGLVTSQTFAAIAFIILGVFFVFLILVLGYMTAVLDIFTTSIWYYAYKQGKQKMEKNT